MSRVVVDVASADVETLVQDLRKAPGVVSVHRAGPYFMDTSFSQVHADVRKGFAEDIEQWLYENTAADYVGAFVIGDSW